MYLFSTLYVYYNNMSDMDLHYLFYLLYASFLLIFCSNLTIFATAETFGDLYKKYVAKNSPISIPLSSIKFGSFHPLTNAGMDKIKSSIDTNKGQLSNGIIPDR